MKFADDTLKAVDFSSLKEGQVADATFKGFNYQSGFVFGTFVADGESIRAIIGEKADYKIGDLLPHKGMQVEIKFGGTKVSNGVTYPKYWVEF